jgi:hypothetical protein
MSDDNNEVDGVEYVGQAKFGTDKPKRNWDNANWSIKKGETAVYRILPPFGRLAPSGKWFKYETIVWGFKGTNGKQRPFRSTLVKNRKGMIERPDPTVAWIESRNQELQDQIKELKSKGKTKAEIERLTEPLQEFVNQYRVNKFLLLNVMRPDGQIGRLTIKYKHKQALDALFEDLLNKENINPIDPKQGVWVEFSKKGEGRDTQFFCKAVEDVIRENGKTMKSIRPAPLTADDIKRMKDEAWDLTMAYRDISDEDVARLAESRGDPEVVDFVFGTKVTKTETVDVPEEAAPSEDMDAEQVVSRLVTPKKAKGRVLDGLENDDLDF